MGSQRNVNAYRKVRERSGGVCERCRSARATEVHHKRLRSQGGSDALHNLADLCGDCHRWLHNHIDEAAAEGLIITTKHHGAEVARQYET